MRRAFFSAVALALVASACAEILGIVDAERDAAASSGTGAANAACVDYCQKIEAGCGDDSSLKQYDTPAQCQAACELFDPGEPGDNTGNNLACRTNFATDAANGTEEQTACPNAGPAGNGQCGDDCESFCDLFEKICSSQFDDLYDGQSQCTADCEASFGVNGTYNSSKDMGVSVQCRVYHVIAALGDKDIHCPHAAGEPNTPCVAAGMGGMGGAAGAGGN